jgi:hypothetical protein
LIIQYNVVQAQDCVIKANQYTLSNAVFIETVQVLLSDTTIKDGLYLRQEKILKSGAKRLNHTYFTEDSLYYYVLREKGWYAHNQKDSIWIENFGVGFYRIGAYRNDCKIGHWQEYYQENLCGKGVYDKNKKIGNWDYYDVVRNKDNYYMTYNYDNSMLSISTKYRQKEESIWFKNYLQNAYWFEPVFLYGGIKAFNHLLHDPFTPHNIPRDMIGCFDIYIKISVDVEGQTQSTIQKVSKDEQDALKNEFSRICPLIPIEWIPARQNKIPVLSSVIYKYRLCLE